MSLYASKVWNTNNAGQNLSLFAPNTIHFPPVGERSEGRGGEGENEC